MASNYSRYKRLLNYVKPYKTRLIIAILAGFLSGGSIFGILLSSGNLFKPFDTPEIKKVTDNQSVSAEYRKDVAPSPENIENPTSNIKNKINRNTNSNKIKKKKLKTKKLEKFQKLAKKYNLPTTKKNGTMTWQFMLLTVIGVPFFFLLRTFFMYINNYFMRWIGGRVIADLRNDLFNSLQAQSLKFYGKCDIGHLVSRNVSDTATIERMVSRTIADITRAPIELSAAIIFVFYSSAENNLYSISLTMFIGLPLCVLPVIIVGRKIKKYTRRALERIALLVSRMHETFTCVKVVKAFHMQKHEKKRFNDANMSYFSMVIKALRAELLMSPLMEFVAVICACGFFVYCYSSGVVLSEIIPLGAAAIIAYKPLKVLSKINSSLQRGMAGAERVLDMIDMDTCVKEIETPVKVSNFNDKFVFDNVSFRYEDNSPAVLNKFFLEIHKGEIVAFVGETGSGKTTIANLLARFYDPSDGIITIDGIDLKELEIKSLRNLIGVVSQETVLFNESIAYNISYGTPGASHDQIINAAKQANAHEFIMKEEEGYDRIVGDKGFRLSGGQRQRISIARAILKNPPILILDEATSALDTVTEQLVQEALNNLMEHRTVLAIAHRLSTIKHADKICVLANAKIIESGTHDELSQADTKYRELCDMQFN
ncbi:MAG: ABC transporter ATP-binding protein [Verrucomicrobiota bacterium]|nr:ABC transporter ATP-binding protein [Verrucomicrobiota bacterium]